MTPNQKTNILKHASHGCPLAACAAIAGMTIDELDAERAADRAFDRDVEICQLQAVAELQAILYTAATEPVDKENRVEWRAALEILKTCQAWGKAQAPQQRRQLDDLSFAASLEDE